MNPTKDLPRELRDAYLDLQREADWRYQEMRDCEIEWCRPDYDASYCDACKQLDAEARELVVRSEDLLIASMS